MSEDAESRTTQIPPRTSPNADPPRSRTRLPRLYSPTGGDPRTPPEARPPAGFSRLSTDTRTAVRSVRSTRYLYCTSGGRSSGHSGRHGFLALPSMVRGCCHLLESHALTADRDAAHLRGEVSSQAWVPASGVKTVSSSDTSEGKYRHVRELRRVRGTGCRQERTSCVRPHNGARAFLREARRESREALLVSLVDGLQWCAP